jgi:hypothetical protein
LNLISSYSKSDFFDFILFKLCEYIEKGVYIEIIIEIIQNILNIEDKNILEYKKYYETINNIYNKKSVKKHFSLKSLFKLESIIKILK